MVALEVTLHDVSVSVVVHDSFIGDLFINGNLNVQTELTLTTVLGCEIEVSSTAR